MEELPEPHEGMTPEEKGELLLRHVRSERPLRGLDFSGARAAGVDLSRRDLTDVKLGGADLHGADLRGSLLTRAFLGRSSLAGAALAGARFERADLSGANLSGADVDGADFGSATMVDTTLTGISGTPIWSLGSVMDERTIATIYTVKGGVGRSTLLSQLRGIPTLVHEVGHHLLSLMAPRSGLSFTFDTRLHRLDPAAIEVLISELFGSDTDVTVEERSPADTEAPSFIRINGKDPDQLAALAQAFYDRVWRLAAAEADRRALERVMSRGMGMVLERLDALRDGWNGATINHPTLTAVPAGAALVCTDPAARIANLHQAVAEENRVRALEQLILRLFAPGTLHAWVELNYGVEVAAELPGPSAPHAQVVAEAVVVWGRRGLIGEGLFERLAGVQEGAQEAVRGVAGKWADPRARP